MILTDLLCKSGCVTAIYFILLMLPILHVLIQDGSYTVTLATEFQANEKITFSCQTEYHKLPIISPGGGGRGAFMTGLKNVSGWGGGGL